MKKSFWDSFTHEPHAFLYQYLLVKLQYGLWLVWVNIEMCKIIDNDNNLTIDNRINVKVWMKIVMFKQALCKEIVFPLSESFMGIDIISSWKHFPYLAP